MYRARLLAFLVGLVACSAFAQQSIDPRNIKNLPNPLTQGGVLYVTPANVLTIDTGKLFFNSTTNGVNIGGSDNTTGHMLTARGSLAGGPGDAPAGGTGGIYVLSNNTNSDGDAVVTASNDMGHTFSIAVTGSNRLSAPAFSNYPYIDTKGVGIWRDALYTSLHHAAIPGYDPVGLYLLAIADDPVNQAHNGVWALATDTQVNSFANTTNAVLFANEFSLASATPTVNADPFSFNASGTTTDTRFSIGVGDSIDLPGNDISSFIDLGASGGIGARVGINIASVALSHAVLTHPPAIAMASGTNGVSLTWYKAAGYSTPAWQIFSSDSTVNGNTLDLQASAAVFSTDLKAASFAPSSSLTAHGVLLAQGTSPFTATAAGSSNTVLHGNTGADPTYSAVSLTADVSGILPMTDGGTGSGSFAANAIPYSNGTVLTSDATKFSWDATNHRLGIGTGTPGYPIDVEGAANDTTTISTTVSNSSAGTHAGATYNLLNNLGDYGALILSSSTNVDYGGEYVVVEGNTANGIMLTTDTNQPIKIASNGITPQLTISSSSVTNAVAEDLTGIETDALSATWTVTKSRVVCNKATAMTETAPASGWVVGRQIRIYNLGAGQCTVDSGATHLIGAPGAQTKVLNQGDGLSMFCQAVNAGACTQFLLD